MREYNNPNAPYASKFRNELYNLREKKEVGSIYCHLFDLKTDEDLEVELEKLHTIYNGEDSYYKEHGKTDWFAIWHKSIRQVDYFDNIHSFKCVNKLSPEQEIELKDTQGKMEILKKKVIVELKRGCTEEDVKAHEESYKTLYAMPEYTDLLKKLKSLNKIKKTEEDLHLSGVMDSILWNMIHVDKESSLYKILKYTFAYIEAELETKTAN